MEPGCRVDALTTENQSALHLAASEGYWIMAVPSSATEAEEAQTDAESHGPSTGAVDYRQEDANEECSNMDHQEQSDQMSNELPNPQEKEQQRAGTCVRQKSSTSWKISWKRRVSYQENIVMEVTNQVLEGMSDTEVSNNSTIRSVVMEVNNTDAQNGDNECPVLETQPESNE
ncbi:hypothetical protein OS493_040017 [Desmophyllum pertusum]|uniref:Uncharacterized protein n=1 Tax=Desmophyllum pertusum TaxID=174260 RepID=A0A9W9Y6K2_9CNID|nr:hypothetical protein OS493_040017 [Desmophyllum pertusum]